MRNHAPPRGLMIAGGSTSFPPAGERRLGGSLTRQGPAPSIDVGENPCYNVCERASELGRQRGGARSCRSTGAGAFVLPE